MCPTAGWGSAANLQMQASWAQSSTKARVGVGHVGTIHSRRATRTVGDDGTPNAPTVLATSHATPTWLQQSALVLETYLVAGVGAAYRNVSDGDRRITTPELDCTRSGSVPSGTGASPRWRALTPGCRGSLANLATLAVHRPRWLLKVNRASDVFHS
jgi:hypothetical protein